MCGIVWGDRSFLTNAKRLNARLTWPMPMIGAQFSFPEGCEVQLDVSMRLKLPQSHYNVFTCFKIEIHKIRMEVTSYFTNGTVTAIVWADRYQYKVRFHKNGPHPSKMLRVHCLRKIMFPHTNKQARQVWIPLANNIVNIHGRIAEGFASREDFCTSFSGVSYDKGWDHIPWPLMRWNNRAAEAARHRLPTEGVGEAEAMEILDLSNIFTV